jgi:hypothetical protein
MNAATNLQPKSVYTIEDQINEYKSLSRSIKELEAQRDKLKKEMITDYFSKYDTYENEKGLVLATYKKSIRISFDQSAFKQHHEMLYTEFLGMKEVATLLVK